MNPVDNRITLFQCDITKLEFDAIVNAINSSLMFGGEVNGALQWAGGSSILEEYRQIVAWQGRCQTSELVITSE